MKLFKKYTLCYKLIGPKTTLYMLISLILPISLFAQEDTTTAKYLNEVTVVTSQYKPQSIKQSVYQIRVIDSLRIRLSGATNAQQVLMNQLGIRFSNDNTLGTTDVQLLGMSGRNVKILLDGVPMIDRGDTRESLGQIDINSIDRIEIVEGPMSVSFGSDALAGVINIITKKPEKNSFSLTAKLQEETVGREYYPFSYKGVHNQNLGMSWYQDNWSVSTGFNHNEFDGFQGDEYGRGKKWRPKEQWMGNARIGYSNQAISVYYRLDALNETIMNKRPMNVSNYRAIDQSFITNRFMHQLQSAWQIKPKMNLSSIVSYTDYERSTKTVRHDFIKQTTELTTGEGEQDVAKFKSFIFRNTFSWFVSPKISLQPGIDINHENASGARIVGTPAITDYAFFISSEIKPNRSINIRPGLRFIKNTAYNAPPVIPSINAKFAVSKNVDIRFAYAYGFRSPALRELYFNFIDANHIIVGNPNLKAEYSNSFSGSVSWNPTIAKHIAINSTLTSFYNVFNNLINYANSPTSADTTITVNIDQFKTVGATWENQFVWKNLNAAIGFSTIGRYNALSSDKTYQNSSIPHFSWTPELNANLSYTVAKINTSFGLYYKYSGIRPGYQLAFNATTQKEEVHLVKIGSFHWADFTITKPLFKYFTVTGGVKNIFDITDLSNTFSNPTGIHTSGGAVPMGYGRSYFIGLSLHWIKKNH